MIDLTKVSNIYLFTGPTDFRLGMIGLNKLVSVNYKGDTISGNAFVFCSKGKQSIKILEYDSTGLSLYQKKLSKGKFNYPSSGLPTKIEKEQLRWLIEGIELILKIENKESKVYDYF